ncbi:MAG: hypothetical protein AAF741_15515 [Bacteroidota bacterium]
MVEVSDKAFDLWSKLTELNDARTSIALAISFGYDISASADNFPQAFDQAKAYLSEFSTYAYDQYLSMQINEVQDQLSDIRDNREDAVDDQNKSNKRIEKWQNKIRKYEEKIADERSSLVEEGEVETQSEARIAELELELSRLQSMRTRYLNGRR